MENSNLKLQGQQIDQERRTIEKTLDVGSPLYIAPEIETSCHYTEKSDVFSLGMVLFELLA